jgi:predicted Fe-Mo cluster-binding NifX family protein
MKIALTTSGDTIESALDSRFGRAPRFLIYNTDNSEFKIIDNTQNLNAEQGAGIQSAQKVIEAGAKAVITGHTGPKAFTLLNNSGIKIYHTEVKTVKGAINSFTKGTLKCADNADVEGHW